MRLVSSAQIRVNSERLAVSRQRTSSWRKIFFCCLLLTACCSLSCSIPNLEPAECSEARQTVKEFYSNYFGNEQPSPPQDTKKWEKYLSADFIKTAAQSNANPFTLTNDAPKAFRIGSCQVTEPGKKANFQILLFWKTDSRSEQKEIAAETVKENDKWLINRIFNENR